MAYKTVGLDITTGHGADSFFYSNTYKDPWSEYSLKQLINLSINHEHVFFPLPSKKAKDELDDSDLPRIYTNGKHIGIKPLLTKTADDISFPNDLLNDQYKLFSEWASNNIIHLIEWVTYHRETPSLKDSHEKHVPIHKVSEFWNSRTDKSLDSIINLPNDKLLYSFDVFVRALLYNQLFENNEHCFFHPIREKALNETSPIDQFNSLWSWGDYFTNQMIINKKYNDPSWLIENLISVKEETVKYGADWYSLAEELPENKIEAIENVAMKSNLPASLKKNTRLIIESSLGIAAAATFSLPVVSAIFATGAISVEFVSNKIPGKYGEYKIFKGQLEWPKLFK